jgi:hypothetical protein
MPMIDLYDKEGNVRWTSVLVFNSICSACSYVKHSSMPLRIIKKGDQPIYWVCNPEDAEWIRKQLGYEELK